MAHKNASNWSPYKGGKGSSGEGKKNRRPLRGRHRQPPKVFPFNQADDRLQDIFRNHGFEKVPHETRHQFVKFYHLLMKVQTKENFTRLLSLKDVAIRHFIDCMIVNDLTELSYPLLDMGTGPGFPGIPLRIVTSPDNKIVLSEGVQRRVEFLKKVRTALELENLHIIGRNVTPEFTYPVQGVITRAVEDARNTLGNVINCLPVGGKVFLMKGPNVDPEIPVAKKTWAGFYELENDIAYELPNTPHRRRLLVYKKLRHKDEKKV